MRTGLSKVRRIEAAFLAPATFALIAALPFGIILIGFTLTIGLVMGAANGSNALFRTLHDLRDLFALFLVMLAGAAGMISLWITIWFGKDWVSVSSRRRNAIAIALLAALVATAYWFTRLGIPPHDAGSRKALLVWTGLLSVPAILAVRYLLVLTLPSQE